MGLYKKTRSKNFPSKILLKNFLTKFLYDPLSEGIIGEKLKYLLESELKKTIKQEKIMVPIKIKIDTVITDKE